jgi:uncharacterized protein
MNNKNHINYDELLSHVIDGLIISPSSIHGLNHWKSVERYGLFLFQSTGVNQIVVRLFAIFHDCKRMNDGHDKHHGLRGANFAKQLRNKLFSLSDELFDLLYEACADHTDHILNDDPTIATCWDADRLDLKRIGIQPDISYLNTEIAKSIVINNNYEILNNE